VFGFVTRVASDTRLEVEGWLLDKDWSLQPAPAHGTAYRVLGVVMARVKPYDASTAPPPNALVVDHFFDLTGAGVQPGPGAPYELFLASNYALETTAAVRSVTVIGNTFRRGWSDQCSTDGEGSVIVGNVFEDGQDHAITLNGNGNVVSGNRIDHQGVTGIGVFGSNSAVTGNQIFRTTWTTDQAPAPDNTNAGIVVGGSYLPPPGSDIVAMDNVVAENVVDGQNAPFANYGIVTYSRLSTGNTFAGNVLRNNHAADIWVASVPDGEPSVDNHLVANTCESATKVALAPGVSTTVFDAVYGYGWDS